MSTEDPTSDQTTASLEEQLEDIKIKLQRTVDHFSQLCIPVLAKVPTTTISMHERYI